MTGRFLRSRKLLWVQLHQDDPRSLQLFRSLGQQPAHQVQSVGPAVQGDYRLLLNFRLKGGDAAGGDVGKVGYDNIHRLRDRIEQIAVAQPYPVGNAVAPDVVGCHVQGGLGDVDGVNLGGRQVDG